MVAVSTIAVPNCGLYRTTRALRGDGEIPAGILVNFHNHSDDGAPVVHLPAFSSMNRWQWEKKAHPIRDRVWIETLRPLLLEGYYLLRDDLEFDDAKWPARSLVQLGYDAEATPILFVPEWTRAGIALPERGTRIDADRIARLRAVEIVRADDSPPDAMTMH